MPKGHDKLNGSAEIRFGDTIALQAHNGQYLVAEGGGGKTGRNGHQVNANRAKIGPWEKFTLFKSKY